MTEKRQTQSAGQKQATRLTNQIIRTWHYLRPHQKWQCARPCEGLQTCTQGPNAAGKCTQTPACHPIRNERTRRCWWTFGVCSVIFLIIVSGIIYGYSAHQQWQWIFSPGRLNIVHESVEHSCLKCHQNTHSEHIPNLSDGQTPSAINCASCHAFGNTGHLAHTLDKPSWEKYSETLGLPPIAEAILTTETACADCHTEHQGVEGQLTRQTNAPCQSCHQSTFQNLSEHPQVALGIPTAQSAFNHNRHYGRYFKKHEQNTDSPTPCEQCHTLTTQSPTGLSISPFEKTCLSCHNEDLTYEISDFGGIPFLTFPNIDMSFLNQQGHSLGQWPTGIPDAPQQLDPITLSLLSTARTRPISNELLAALGSGDIDLEHLTNACKTLADKCPSDQWLAQEVEKIAYGIKELLLAFNRAGPEAFQKRWNAQTLSNGADTPTIRLTPPQPTVQLQQQLGRQFTKLRTEKILTKYLTTELLPVTDIPPATPSNASAAWAFKANRLLYIPNQHKDALISSFVDRYAGTQYVFSLIETNDGCFRCHNKPGTKMTDSAVNTIWEIGHSKRHTTEFLFKRLFNRSFDHQTHVVGDTYDCLHCHSQPLQEITFSTCHACHAQAEQTASCQTCHTYHAVENRK